MQLLGHLIITKQRNLQEYRQRQRHAGYTYYLLLYDSVTFIIRVGANHQGAE